MNFNKEYIQGEIKRIFKIYKMLTKSTGYSTYGDRSEHFIRFCKTINDLESLELFRESLHEFLSDNDKKKSDFIADCIIDGIEFGKYIN